MPKPARLVLGFFQFALVAAGLVGLSPLGAAVPTIALRQVASGLSLPVELVSAKDGSNRLFIVEQGGRIRILQNGSVLATPFLDISGTSVISAGGERGLLGLAFHPNYTVNGAFYVFYTRTGDGALVVARLLRSANNANVADANSRVEIISVPHSANSNHNGGKIAFGPDGYLYIATGDGGGGGDPLRAGLSLTTRLGKLLRIAVDGGTGYTVPTSNPYAGQSCATACPEIWAYGLRNPWKFSFDRVDGSLFIGDVGQGAVEEVNFLAAGSPGGTNFGWGAFEGNNCYNNNDFGVAGACTTQAGHTRPVLTYGHDANGGFAITGGYRYRGTASAALEGFYFCADYSSRRIWAARPTMPGAFATEVILPPPANVSSVSSFGEDESGNLYLVDYGNGRIHAIDGPATELTQTELLQNHSGAGSLPISFRRDAPLEGAIGVESRAVGGPRSMQFTFSTAVSAFSAVNVRDASGAIIATPIATIGSTRATLDLPPSLEGRRFQIEIDGLDGVGARIVIPAGILVGDVTASGKVTAADLAAIKARQGLMVTSQNARFDLDRSGIIDSADLALAKSRSGSALN
jgi:glucose/arabinose dehydrogenase